MLNLEPFRFELVSDFEACPGAPGFLFRFSGVGGWPAHAASPAGRQRARDFAARAAQRLPNMTNGTVALK